MIIKEREEGYYWVFSRGIWEVSLWDGMDWMVVDSPFSYEDSSFEIILDSEGPLKEPQGGKYD